MAASKEDVDCVMANMEQMAKEMQSLTLENKNMKEKLNMVSSNIKFFDVATGESTSILNFYLRGSQLMISHVLSY